MLRGKFKRTNEEELLKKFANEAGEPSHAFEKKLEAKLLQKLEPSTTNFSSIFEMTKRKAVVAGSLLAAVVLLGGGSYLIYPQVRNEYVKHTVDVNDVLSKALQNNAFNTTQDGMASSSNLLARAEAASGADDSAGTSLLAPVKTGYTKITTTMKNGPSIDKCKALNSYTYGSNIGKSVSESFNGTDIYYSKYTDYDESGNLVSYSLSTPNGSYSYAGGEYAVFEKYSIYPAALTEPGIVEDSSDAMETVEEPSDEVRADREEVTEVTQSVEILPEVIDDIEISQYFGEDTELLGTEKINGKDTYVVSWKYQFYCDSGNIRIEPLTTSVDSDIAGEGETFVNKVWFDSETYEMVKNENYIGSITPDNLILTTESQTEYMDVPFDQMKDRFVFDFNLPVRVIEYDYSIEAEKARYIKELETSEYNFIVPEGEWFVASLDLTAAAEDDSYFEYWSDRSYYPAGSRGDAMYQEATRYNEDVDYLMPDLSITYSSDEVLYMTYESYETSLKGEALLKELGRVSDETVVVSKSTETVSLNGVNVQVEAFVVKYKTSSDSERPVEAPDSIQSSPPNNGTTGGGSDGNSDYSEKMIIFSDGNQRNMFTYSLNGFEGKEPAKFTSYKTSNSAGLKAAKELLNDYYSNTHAVDLPGVKEDVAE